MKDAGAQLERWGRRGGLEPLDLWFRGLRPRGAAGGGHPATTWPPCWLMPSPGSPA